MAAHLLPGQVEAVKISQSSFVMPMICGRYENMLTRLRAMPVQLANMHRAQTARRRVCEGDLTIAHNKKRGRIWAEAPIGYRGQAGAMCILFVQAPTVCSYVTPTHTF